VVIEVEVVETTEEEDNLVNANLVNNVKTGITFCVDIARSQAT